MPTSSAEPARLEAYPGQLTIANDQLTTLASDLDSAMQSFARGAGAFLPGGFDAAYCGNLIRGLRDESLHLEGWVLSVARAFRAADTDPDGDGIFSAEDSIIDETVGQATIAGQRAEVDGREAAHDLTDRLLAMGIDPRNFTPEQLHNLIMSTDDAALQQLYRQMQGVAGRMWDPAYATGFYDVMGAEGTRTTLGVIDTFAYMRHSGGAFEDSDWMGSVQSSLLAPMVGGFALATRSPETEEDRRELLNTTNSIEQRHLSLLMSGNPSNYDSHFLADGADRILVSGRHLNAAQWPLDHPPVLRTSDYPGYHSSTEWLYDDHALGVPSVIAMRALAGNDAAGLDFIARGSEHVHALAYPEPPEIPNSPRTYPEFGQWADELERNGANVVEYGVTYSDEAVRGRIMNNVIDVVATEDDRLNEHMYGPLAAGVENNMPVIDRRINEGWVQQGSTFVHPGDDTALRNTDSFLTELMGNEDASDRVRRATVNYVDGRIDALPAHPGDEGPEHDRAAMHGLGRILGVTTEADMSALEQSFEDEKNRDELVGRVVDYALSWGPPGVSRTSDLLQLADASVGKWFGQDIVGTADEAAFRADMRKLAIEYQQIVYRDQIGGDDGDAMLAGSTEVRNELI
jgi:hypothetical protein